MRVKAAGDRNPTKLGLCLNSRVFFKAKRFDKRSKLSLPDRRFRSRKPVSQGSLANVSLVKSNEKLIVIDHAKRMGFVVLHVVLVLHVREWGAVREEWVLF